MLATAFALTGAGCSSGDDDGVEVGAAAYEAVLTEFLPDVTPSAADDRPIVYVAPLGAEPLSLDIQVAMIDAVAETYDLRFVDDVGAAVDGDDDGAPPRDDGLLLGIGIIPSTPPHVVRVEIYNDADQVEAHRLTLIERGTTWSVETSEPVDPEGLVGDE